MEAFLMPRTSIFLVSLFFLSCFLCSSAAAANVSVSFSDLNLVHSQEFDLYQVAGDQITYVGTYNASETVLELHPTYSCQAVLQPRARSWLAAPFTALEGAPRPAPPILSLFML